MKKDSVASFRSLGQNWSKLLAMSLIIALSFAFIFGLSITPNKAKDTIALSLVENRAYDLNVKSTSEKGFSKDEKEKLSAVEGAEVEYVFSLDNASLDAEMSFYELLDAFGTEALMKQDGMTQENAEHLIRWVKVLLPDQKDFLTLSPELMADGNYRLMAFPDGKKDTVNVFNLEAGRMPVSDSEIAVDYLYRGAEIDDTVSLFGKEYKVVGAVRTPLYYVRSGEPDLINLEPLEGIFYLNGSSPKAPSIDALLKESVKTYVDAHSANLPESIKTSLKEALDGMEITYSFPEFTDAYLYFPERDASGLFSSEYEAFLKDKKEALSALSKDITVLTPNDAYSRTILKQSCKKMNSIILVLPVFFLAVSGLVVSISMSRMIEENRSRIACLSSLGYHDFRISLRYYFQALASTLTGILIGLGVGYHLVFPLIYDAFNYLFLLPEKMASSIDFPLTLVSGLIMVAIITALTFAQLKQTLHPLPAELLLPKSPGEGTQTRLERSSFWKKLPFRAKSTIRNLARFKKRVWMTLLSVGGSTAIVFAGFSLFDITQALQEGEGGAVAKSIVPVSYFLIIFAILLVALVLYNLTNMSITERERELATLEVLGYHDGETVLYLYREIAVMTVLGLILGIPLGMGLMEIVVLYLEFGSLADIRWYSYLAPVAVAAFFAVVVDLLLLPKILKIDMISSLKSVD